MKSRPFASARPAWATRARRQRTAVVSWRAVAATCLATVGRLLLGFIRRILDSRFGQSHRWA
jgi:hypothetical protein